MSRGRVVPTAGYEIRIEFYVATLKLKDDYK
jgi:hypothetical protein